MQDARNFKQDGGFVVTKARATFDLCVPHLCTSSVYLIYVPQGSDMKSSPNTCERKSGSKPLSKSDVVNFLEGVKIFDIMRCPKQEVPDSLIHSDSSWIVDFGFMTSDCDSGWLKSEVNNTILTYFFFSSEPNVLFSVRFSLYDDSKVTSYFAGSYLKCGFSSGDVAVVQSCISALF